MADNDEKGAQKLATMILGLLAFATICVMFSCYRICREKRLRRKQQQQSPPIDPEPNLIYSIIDNQATARISDTQQSDYQIVFGLSAGNTTVVSTSPNRQDELLRNRFQCEIQNEYERRAQERRQNLDVVGLNSVPPYNSEDTSLPTYDQAVKL